MHKVCALISETSENGLVAFDVYRVADIGCIGEFIGAIQFAVSVRLINLVSGFLAFYIVAFFNLLCW